MPTFDDISEQPEATQRPTQLRQRQHNESHMTTIAWVKSVTKPPDIGHMSLKHVYFLPLNDRKLR